MRYRINLKTEREKRNMTQANLAKLIGVTEKSISKWESGRGQPSYENMLKICKEFNIDINKVDNKAIIRNRINIILNGCLVLVNLTIVILIFIQVAKMKNSDPLTGNLSVAGHSQLIGEGNLISANRLKILLKIFIIAPLINLFIPSILRKHVLISACVAIANVVFCMFVFKDLNYSIFKFIGIISLFIIGIILFANFKTNKEFKVT
ncbi:MAG: helix-turn-helix transcriptional regulator [Erysipelotrichales bacterium]|nr:helix-turn-helix transcriptional regulator [Erysipelotrichales bacterium]